MLKFGLVRFAGGCCKTITRTPDLRDENSLQKRLSRLRAKEANLGGSAPPAGVCVGLWRWSPSASFEIRDDFLFVAHPHTTTPAMRLLGSDISTY